MRLKNWFETFCETHERARSGELSPEANAEYRASGKDVLAFMVMVQRLSQEPGQRARMTVRLARAYQIEFDFPDAPVTAFTQDVSAGGVSAIVGKSPPAGTICPFSLKFTKADPPVTGNVKVVNIIDNPDSGSQKLAVAFDGLDQIATERIEDVLLDYAVQQLKKLKNMMD